MSDSVVDVGAITLVQVDRIGLWSGEELMPEKITINLEPVDLGRIDVLVDQGLYTNRTDLIRTAIRNQLSHHEEVIEGVKQRQSFAVGVLSLGRADLEKHRRAGERLSIRMIGLLHLHSDVDADLARETIESVTVRGVLRAPEEVKALFAE